MAEKANGLTAYPFPFWGLYGYSCAVLSVVTYPLLGEPLIGESLGPYKILAPLGRGGMGEVYLAEDTRLKRKVAIKVLPAEFASDPERLARFEQEARAAAALNHPHIAAVFDVGQELVELGGGDDGGSDSGDSGPVKSEAVVHYIVQEYLEGQTLADQINSKGATPTKKALDLGVEIASALSAAHEAGIVHRDLKPANVFVSPDGHAKVLDFGLAKLTELAAINADSGSSGSLSPPGAAAASTSATPAPTPSMTTIPGRRRTLSSLTAVPPAFSLPATPRQRTSRT